MRPLTHSKASGGLTVKYPILTITAATICQLAACGGSTSAPTSDPSLPAATEPSGNTTAGNPISNADSSNSDRVAPQQTNGPDYFRNGFEVSEDGPNRLIVYATNSDGIVQTMRLDSAAELDASFDGETRTLRIVSGGQSFENGFDREGVVFDEILRLASDTSGSVYLFKENDGTNELQSQAVMAIGDYGFGVLAQLDQDDGLFKHTVSFVNGAASGADRLPGSANYSGSFNGVVEEFRQNTQTQQSQAFAVNGFVDFDIDFPTGRSEITAIFSDSNDDFAGVVFGDGVPRADGSIGINFGDGSLVRVDGNDYEMQGAFVGGIVGPEAEEVAVAVGGSGRISRTNFEGVATLSGVAIAERTLVAPVFTEDLLGN